MLVDLARNDLAPFAPPAAATSPILPKLTVTLRDAPGLPRGR